MTTLRFLALALATSLSAACAVADDDATESTTTQEAALRPDFELWRSTDGWRFHLQAVNGETLITSESYSSRTAAIQGVLAVLDNGGKTDRYELRTAINGDSYFNLLAGNRAVIGTSEMYETAAGARAGVDATITAVTDYALAWDTATGARFDVFQGADQRFYFDLRAKNGAIVLTSQGYATEASALNGAFSVSDNGVRAASYRILQAVDGRWYFNLYASNGQVIATSQMYSSKYNAERGRDGVVALLPEIDLL